MRSARSGPRSHNLLAPLRACRQGWLRSLAGRRAPARQGPHTGGRACLLSWPRADRFHGRDAQECSELGRGRGNTSSYGRTGLPRPASPPRSRTRGRPHGLQHRCAVPPLMRPPCQRGVRRRAWAPFLLDDVGNLAQRLARGVGSLARRHARGVGSLARRLARGGSSLAGLLPRCIQRLARGPANPCPHAPGPCGSRAGTGIVVTLPGETNDLCVPRRFMIFCHSRGLHRTYMR